MKKTITPTLIDLEPEQKERLRGAMRILVEYLLEKGYLGAERHLATAKDGQNHKYVSPSSTISSVDQV